jgi:hypothetical protein
MDDIKVKMPCTHYFSGVGFTSSTCPICMGRNYYYDIFINNTGDIDKVSASARFSQDLEKVLVEHLGSCMEDSQWGSELYKTIAVGEPTLTKAHVVAAVINALKRYKELSMGEDRQYGLSNTEKIADKGIGDLQIIEDPTDPRRLTLMVTVVSEGRNDVTITTPLSI